MDFNLLPTELLKTIITFLDDVDDAKNLSQTSKRLYDLTLERIWSKPRFYEKDSSFLEKISNYPIKELYTSDFNCSWADIAQVISGLGLLHIDKKYKREEKSSYRFDEKFNEICEIKKNRWFFTQMHLI